jgi:hypothetical protein
MPNHDVLIYRGRDDMKIVEPERKPCRSLRRQLAVQTGRLAVESACAQRKDHCVDSLDRGRGRLSR